MLSASERAYPWPKLTLPMPLKVTFTRLRGFVCEPSGKRGFTFILRSTIEHVSGPAPKGLPSGDLFIHVRDNPELSEHIPGRAWIEFSTMKEERRRDGITACNAQLIQERTAS
jgi:hypothetical protein